MGKKGFQRRYFVLQDTVLKYFREINSTATAGSINLTVQASQSLSPLPPCASQGRGGWRKAFAACWLAHCMIPGVVALQEVLSVEESIVPDAPQNALDLRTKDRLYTLAAETEADMLRWALAITQVVGAKGERTRSEAPEVQWQRFDVTFEVHRAGSSTCPYLALVTKLIDWLVD